MQANRRNTWFGLSVGSGQLVNWQKYIALRRCCSLLGLLPLLLAGCSLIEFVPVPRELPFSSRDQASYPVLGLLNISEHAKVPVRMFMIHGMSDHEPGWAQGSYLGPIEKEAGWTVTLPLTNPVDVRWEETVADKPSRKIVFPVVGFAGTLLRYQIVDRSGRPVLIAYELTWSNLTRPFKLVRFGHPIPNIENQTPPTGARDDVAQRRPGANEQLRNAIDLYLSDVALYARGFDGQVINKTVDHALQMFYEGALEPDQSPEARDRRRTEPTVFLSESLGSVMLMEAFAKQERDWRPGQPTADAEKYSHLKDASQNLRVVYMMANQMALLNMPKADRNGNAVPVLSANRIEASSNEESEQAPPPVWDAFYNARKNLGTSDDDRLTIAAFSDLYDVLSWPANPTSIPAASDGAPVFNVDNFYPVNSIALFAPIGIEEDPDSAHTGYGTNSKVYKLMVNGYPP
jgi:hypothetical protein